MTDNENTLERFLTSNLNREWVYVTTKKYEINAYLRKARRFINGKMVRTLDLASITVIPQHAGGCSALLDRLELLNTFDMIFVESVLNEDLAAYLARRGYECIGEECQPNYFKELPQKPKLA